MSEGTLPPGFLPKMCLGASALQSWRSKRREVNVVCHFKICSTQRTCYWVTWLGHLTPCHSGQHSWHGASVLDSGDLVEMTITGKGVAMGGICCGKLSVINSKGTTILGNLVSTSFIWTDTSNFLDNFVNIIEHLFVITSALKTSKSFLTDTVGKCKVWKYLR